MDNISISTQLSVNDYIKVNFYLIYRKWTIKLMVIAGILLLFFAFFPLSYNQGIDYKGLAFSLFILFGLPVIIYFESRKNYNSNRRLNEQILYEIDNEIISVKGESFNSKMSWDKIYKVTENKNWVLVWQNAKIANVIPKRDFRGSDLEILRQIVKSYKSVKNNL